MVLPAKVAPCVHHNVFGLDVAMHDSFGMGRGERAGHLHADFQCFVVCRPFAVKVFAQGRTFYVLLGDVMERTFVSDLMNGDDVGMIEGGSGPRFLLEATQPLSIFREIGGKELERHLATQKIVVGQVNLAHAALAKRRDDSVVAYCFPDRQRCSRTSLVNS